MNLDRISDLNFAAEKVQVEIPNRLPTATNLDTILRDKTAKIMLSYFCFGVN